MINIKMTDRRHKVKIDIKNGAELADLTSAIYHLGTAFAKVKEQDYELWEIVRRHCLKTFAMASNGSSSAEILDALERQAEETL